MINKVILVGNLGSDPELKYTQAGTAVANMSVATTRTWKDKQGQKQDETEWHRIVVWAGTAEFCDKYLFKGMKVYVEGRLQTRKYQDASGSDRYTTEIVADNVQNLSPKQEQRTEPNKEERYPQDAGGNFGTGEDVPFSPIF